MEHKHTLTAFKTRYAHWCRYCRHMVAVQLPVKLFAACSLLMFTLPVCAGGLQQPSMHKLAPMRPHLVLAKPKPIIIGASYQLAPSCSNSRHAISVTVRIRNEGGPLKANLARVQIGATDQHHASIWNSGGASSYIPALAHGQIYTTQQMVGTLPAYRKDLPGAHTLAIELRQPSSGDSQAPVDFPASIYRLNVNIPAGYCQVATRFPPSPCKTKDCIKPGHITFNQRLKPAYPPSPCKTKGCQTAQLSKLDRRAVGTTKLGAALKPNLHVTSIRLRPATATSGKPISVYAVVQNTGAIASTAGKKLHIFCSAFGNWNTPPTRWTCKVPADHTSVGGMPTWDIPLPAIPGHGRADVALRINEHWPDGVYYFIHADPDSAVTINSLKNAKTDQIVQINAK